ncbi:von Willebrand factor type A domain-containing protein [Winogradskyella echinorum]|uniref:von Willebrand factor type A domain-containing protein n=1 Tax=Winogradskyella echinorum TaxID=538189 RepID=A0ABR6Y1G3_9FLAO|nr:VWA domain-containing protein [Winogradskyella echinorum]MBC3846577.1 von Willebrand factor type A domain-containing protein [Winogradskyella echinorum]MBC5750925.1 von Willebrand factor type A domain-containing protein [Winogradskyella echinorum]
MKTILKIIIVLFFSVQLNAQQKTVTGTVTTASDGLPLPGANVLIKGTSQGVTTDFDGKYSISTNLGDKLIFSYIGYKSQSVTVGTKSVIDVSLEASETLDEVVIVGYGTTTKKAYTGTAEVVRSESISSISAPSKSQIRRQEQKRFHDKISKQLADNVQGVNIRGTKAKNSNSNILYIVDGIPIQKGYNQLIDKLNPNDIEHMNVYKSTEALSMFGNSAKDGCIVITTKSGNYRIQNDESYAQITENNFERTNMFPLSTFSIDVDKASYSNVRRMINNGQHISPDAVKIEEMVNYFNYNYPQPTNEHPFSIYTEVVESPWHKETQLVRIGLQGKSYTDEELPASNLTFLIDVSGSMGSQNKLPLLKSAFKLLVNQLRAKDKVSIVVYAGAAGVVLEPTSGDNKEKILAALDNLRSGGSTAGGAGIELAYKLAEKNFKKNGNNRVILATDGDFNVGASSNSDMQSLIEEKRKSGVYLSVLGFGYGNYKDSKLETLADKGNGNHAYIDNMQEAQKVFGKEFGGTLFTIAKDVKIQVEFNPKKVQAYRLIGYENRLLADEDFIDDTKDAGELGSGHTVTALYEIIPTGIKSDYLKTVPGLKYATTYPTSKYENELFTVKFRYKRLDESKSIEMVHVQNTKITVASADMNFASAVALFGMKLRNSKYNNNAKLDRVIELAENGRGEDKEGYRAEFIRLVKSYDNIN